MYVKTSLSISAKFEDGLDVLGNPCARVPSCSDGTARARDTTARGKFSKDYF